MSQWLAFTVLWWIMLEPLVVATCLPASWLMPLQGGQLPAEVLQHLGCDAPSKHGPHQGSSSACDSTENIVAMLQQHWDMMHESSQACPDQRIASDLMLHLSQPQRAPHPLRNIQLHSQLQQQQQQQQLQDWACDQAVYIPAAPSAIASQRSTRSHTCQQQCAAAGSIPAAAGGSACPCTQQQQRHRSNPLLQQQQQQHPCSLCEQHHHHQQQHQCSACGQDIQLPQQLQHTQQASGPVVGSAWGLPLEGGSAEVGSEGQQQHVDGGIDSGGDLWRAWPLLGLQQLWEHLRHDTQVALLRRPSTGRIKPEMLAQVQQQLDKGAKISGQACRSCLAPHVHRSQREVLLEVIALLLLGALCTSALLLAAKVYKRRQSIRRHQQTNISAHRLRQLEKLHLQQQQQAEQQQQLQQQPVSTPQHRLPQLKQHPVSRKHERQKSHESVLPSSPSASSSHSEVIGTAVSSRPKSGGKASRAKSAQREQQVSRPVHTVRRQLGRSHSDISTEFASADCAEHSNVSVHSMAESLTGSMLGAGFVDMLCSEPSTPSSTAELNSAFLPTQGTPHRAAPEMPLSTPTLAASKQVPGKRRQKHKKAASKPPPAKRRFIPGLDEEFDEAVHELPMPPSDDSTTAKGRKGSVGSLGSSNSSPSSPQPLSAAQPTRQLSVNAPPFIPTGYAQGCNLPAALSPQNLQWPLGWTPQQQPLPELAYSYDQLRPPTPIAGPPAYPPSHPFSPQAHIYSSGSSVHSVQLDRGSPASMPWQFEGEQAFRSHPPPGYPKPTPRCSPTSVLPWASESSSAQMSTLPPHSNFLSSSSLMDGPGCVLLPPVLEDVVSSPFPGMRQSPCTLQAETRPAAGNCPQLLPSQGVSSALLDLPRQLPASSVGLPGFSSIWSTTARPATGTGSSESWSSSITSASSNPIW